MCVCACVCTCVCDSGGARLAVWAAECFQTVESVTDTPGRAISSALMSSADHSAHRVDTHTLTHTCSYAHEYYKCRHSITYTHMYNVLNVHNYGCDIYCRPSHSIYTYSHQCQCYQCTHLIVICMHKPTNTHPQTHFLSPYKQTHPKILITLLKLEKTKLNKQTWPVSSLVEGGCFGTWAYNYFWH